MGDSMEKIGVLVVSYGARGTAMIDAISRTQNYAVELYVADKQRNPFNVQKAKRHTVIPDLNVEAILKFVRRYEDRLDFGIVGPEKPIIDGLRDLVERATSVPLVCPTKRYAIEGSKVAQRNLFQKVAPEVNPQFKVFDKTDYSSLSQVKKDVYAWLDVLDNKVAVKPDSPVAGKGVGVWGDHFTNRAEVFSHFLANYKQGPVIIEEKLEGEESSFQAFCDGKHLIPLPETRDYKRAFNDDKGPNTGGMGSYKDVGDTLPFMTSADREKEIEIVNKIFKELLENERNPALLGIPFYEAFIHTSTGPKILENNSRPGDPEILNLLPILKDDFIDVCFKILEGNLTQVEFEKKATVATYKVPPNYGGYSKVFPNRADTNDLGTPVNLNEVHNLSKRGDDTVRVYPAAMELRAGKTYALKSRTLCVVGTGETIQSARERSLKIINAVKGGGLWNRSDIASAEHVEKSVSHLKELRTL